MSIGRLGRYFIAVEDPRCSGKVAHRLVEVLVVAVCAVIACAESWDDFALYGRSKLAWLRTLLEQPNGIPSHDTSRGVFMLIDPDAFEAGLTKWVGSLADRFDREVVAIDGKTVRRSFDHGREQLPLQVVSAWVSEQAWCWASAAWTASRTRSPLFPSGWTSSHCRTASSPWTPWGAKPRLPRRSCRAGATISGERLRSTC